MLKTDDLELSFLSKEKKEEKKKFFDKQKRKKENSLESRL